MHERACLRRNAQLWWPHCLLVEACCEACSLHQRALLLWLHCVYGGNCSVYTTQRCKWMLPFYHETFTQMLFVLPDSRATIRTAVPKSNYSSDDKPRQGGTITAAKPPLQNLSTRMEECPTGRALRPAACLPGSRTRAPLCCSASGPRTGSRRACTSPCAPPPPACPSPLRTTRPPFA